MATPRSDGWAEMANWSRNCCLVFAFRLRLSSAEGSAHEALAQQRDASGVADGRAGGAERPDAPDSGQAAAAITLLPVRLRQPWWVACD